MKVTIKINIFEYIVVKHKIYSTNNFVLKSHTWQIQKARKISRERKIYIRILTSPSVTNIKPALSGDNFDKVHNFCHHQNCHRSTKDIEGFATIILGVADKTALSTQLLYRRSISDPRHNRIVSQIYCKRTICCMQV